MQCHCKDSSYIYMLQGEPLYGDHAAKFQQQQQHGY